MRWIFHVLRAVDVTWGRDGRYRAASLESQGFIHGSFRDAVLESAQLYLGDVAPEDLSVLAIDPRRLDVPLSVAKTPRGPMPHVHGAIPSDAIRVLSLEDVASFPDRVTGTRVGFGAFDGMTLLDLVGPLDALGRVASMGFDPTFACDVFALHPSRDFVVWRGAGATFSTTRIRPMLDEYDVLVLPGGFAARELARDPAISEYVRTFPTNRLLATVCTGALLAGAAGRLDGKRATTHRSALALLREHGAEAVDERVVDEGQIVTASGVTAGIDLGLHLVRRLAGDEAADAIAKQMHWKQGMGNREQGTGNGVG